MTGEGKLKQLALDVVNRWNGAFVTPAETLDDKAFTPEWVNDSISREDAEKEFGWMGAFYYNRMMFLQSQYDKYKEQKNIVYAASPLDILAETLTAFEKYPDDVTETAVDKVTYWFKHAIQSLDLIYILPPQHEKDEKLDETTKRYEEILNGLWIQYTDNFEKAGIYPVDNCAGIAVFETKDPISEMRLVVDEHGNLAGEDSPEQVQKLYDSIKDARLLKNVKDIMEKPQIPIIGVPQSNIIQ